MNQAILSNEVQHFLREHAEAVPADIALKKSPFPKVSSTELASQIASRKKAKTKLPLWYSTTRIYFPAPVSIEQSSSAETASYKTHLIEKDSQLIDLTGGFGVDAFYLSANAKAVIHCEQNEALSSIASYNSKRLGATNITFINGNGIDFLKSQEKNHFDVAYIDPSRRVKKGKVFMLYDGNPNIVEHQEEILGKVDKMIIKAAPLLDLSAALNDLKHVQEIHILSVKNECKEILFLIERGYEQKPTIHAIGLGHDHRFNFSFVQDEEKSATVQYGSPEAYLFEPDAAILKSGAFKLTAQRFNLRKLHQHTHLYTSNEEIKGFPGKRFMMIEHLGYGAFKKIKKKWRANIISRNFPLKTEEIRKRHAIDDGGELYLFFHTAFDSTLHVIAAERLF